MRSSGARMEGCRLEADTAAELQLSIVGAGACDLTYRSRGAADVRVGIAEVSPVQEIKRFCPELKCDLLCDLDVLE